MTVGVDLAEEMFAYGRGVDGAALQHIQRLGITGAAIGPLAVRQSMAAIGIAEGRIDADDIFTPGEGPRHLIQPVMLGTEVVDLVAWRSLRPEAWGLRRGTGWLLGEDALNAHFDAIGGPEPLQLHASPLDWLRASGAGACVVDWASPEVRRLIDVEEIVVADPRLRDVLLQTLSKPVRLPNVRVQRGRHVA